jgi:hypothetical protein
MKQPERMLGALLCGLAVVAIGLCARWPGAGCLQGWNVVRLLEEIEALQKQGENLDAQIQAVSYNLAAKNRIAAAVEAGQLSLLDAADRYRKLNESQPDFDWPAFRERIPAGSEEERHCRQVLGWVEARLRIDQPEKLEAVMARLEAELQHSLAGAESARTASGAKATAD